MTQQTLNQVWVLYGQGKGVKAIADALGLAHRDVRRVIQNGRGRAYLSPSAQRSLDAIRAQRTKI